MECKKIDTRKDAAFKTLVHDKNVLASIIGGLLSEFEGLKREEIIPYLPLNGDKKTVRGMETELFSVKNRSVILDSVFRIDSPKGKMGLIVGIEGQGGGMSQESLSKR